MKSRKNRKLFFGAMLGLLAVGVLTALLQHNGTETNLSKDDVRVNPVQLKDRVRHVRRPAANGPKFLQDAILPSLNLGVVTYRVHVKDSKVLPIRDAFVVADDVAQRQEADGTFLIVGTVTNPVAGSPRHIPAIVRLPEVGDRRNEEVVDVVVALEPGKGIDGRVVDQDRRPLADVNVSAFVGGRIAIGDARSGGFDLDDLREFFQNRAWQRTAVTDNDGRFSISGLPSGKYGLRFMKFGYVLSTVAGENSLLITTGGEASATMSRVFVSAIRFDSKCPHGGSHGRGELSYADPKLPKYRRAHIGALRAELPSVEAAVASIVGPVDLIRTVVPLPDSNVGDVAVTIRSEFGSALDGPIAVDERFVPLDMLQPDDLTRLALATDCPGHGHLRIRGTVAPLITGTVAAKRSVYVNLMPDKEIADCFTADVIAGVYSIVPSTPFSRDNAAQSFAIKNGESKEIILTKAPNMCTFEISVSDSSGRPTCEYFLRISNAATQMVLQGPDCGNTRRIELPAGSYTFELLSGAVESARTISIDAVAGGFETMRLSF